MYIKLYCFTAWRIVLHGGRVFLPSEPNYSHWALRVVIAIHEDRPGPTGTIFTRATSPIKHRVKVSNSFKISYMASVKLFFCLHLLKKIFHKSND